MTTRRVAVIGGGQAGCAAAIEAARHGAAVTLLTDESIGGRGVHASLLPSKVWLHHVGKVTAQGSRGEKERRGDADTVPAEIGRLAQLSEQALTARLDAAGVRVRRGRARFTSSDNLELTTRGSDGAIVKLGLAFDAAVIATGSVPVFPSRFFGDAPGPDGKLILAPRHLRTLTSLEGSMLVLGAGATGAEAVRLFHGMGAKVTWLIDELGILPDFDRELADALGDVVMERGVKLVHDKRVVQLAPGGEGVLAKLDGGRTYTASRAFVAIGRRADAAELGLSEIGVRVDPSNGCVMVDDRLQSSVKGIYAAGDAAGGSFSAAKALAQGWLAGRLAAEPTLAAHQSRALGPWVHAVYSDPEIAGVGLSPERAAAAGRAIDVRTVGFGESLSGLLAHVDTDPHARGVLRVVLDAATGVVLGATAIGPAAATVLAPLALAVRMGCHVDDLGASGAASPTGPELVSLAGRS